MRFAQWLLGNRLTQFGPERAMSATNTVTTDLFAGKTACERGLELLIRLHGGYAGERMTAEMERICPDFARMTIEWALGGVMARPGLDLRTRQLVLSASCVTLGHAMPQLHAHTEAALEIGASKTEIVETNLQMLFYAGGPAVRNALALVDEVSAAHRGTDTVASTGESV